MQLNETNLNIPAIVKVVHEGKSLEIQGKLLSINESAQTCSMSFTGDQVWENIPVANVEINEGLMDKLKSLRDTVSGSIDKVVGWVTKVIKGYVYPVINGVLQKVESPKNALIYQSKGHKLSGGAVIYPCQAAIETASAAGVTVKEPKSVAGTENSKDDLKWVNDWWARVIKEYGKNESYTMRDAVKAVNEQYRRAKKAGTLNEASIYSMQAASDSGMVNMSRQDIFAYLKENIASQIKGRPGKTFTRKPVLIWGAPGIGKTTIVKQLLKWFRTEGFINMNLITVSLANIRAEDFSLPALQHNDKGQEVAVDIAKCWLPLYNVPASTKELYLLDRFYNSARYIPGRSLPAPTIAGSKVTVNDVDQASSYDEVKDIIEENSYEGNLVFFDEFSRSTKDTYNVVMNLIQQGNFNNLQLATKTAFVLAANRMEDMGEEFDWDAAFKDRFYHVNYVPKFEEWLEWAHEVDDNTGKQNIHPSHLQFIETMGEAVWADVLELQQKASQYLEQKDKNQYSVDANTDKRMAYVERQNKTMTTYTPRTHADISNQIYDMEARLSGKAFVEESFEDIWEDMICNDEVNVDGLSKGEIESLHRQKFEEYAAKPNVQGKMKQVSEKEWATFFNDFADVCNPTGVLRVNRERDREEFFENWVDNYTIKMYGERSVLYKAKTAYREYLSAIDNVEFKSIWETGGLSKRYADEDNKASNFAVTRACKWKNSSPLQKEIFERLFQTYPGGDKQMYEDFMAPIDWDIDPMSLADDFKQMKDHYTIYGTEINGSAQDSETYDVPALTEDPMYVGDKLNRNGLNMFNCTNLFVNNKFAFYVGNAAMYALKICLQVGAGFSLVRMVIDMAMDRIDNYAKSIGKEAEFMQYKISCMSVDGNRLKQATSRRPDVIAEAIFSMVNSLSTKQLRTKLNHFKALK